MAPKELSNLAGLLRSGHRGAIDEGGFGPVGADSNLFHQDAAKDPRIRNSPPRPGKTRCHPTPPRRVGGPVYRRCSPAPRTCRMTRSAAAHKRVALGRKSTAAAKKQRQGSPQGSPWSMRELRGCTKASAGRKKPRGRRSGNVRFGDRKAKAALEKCRTGA
jgi:hypothetical protein